MNELNEKLAIEVMDYCQPEDPDGYWWGDDGDYGLEKKVLVNRWKPDSNLKQLQECFFALSEDEQSAFGFENRYAPADWIFTNPKSVGLAILKIKGVEF